MPLPDRRRARKRALPRPLPGAFLLAALALGPPAVADAHKGSPNFRSTARTIVPATPGLDVRVLNYDDRLQLINRSGRTVLVRGYDGEPYIRVLGNGTVEVNRSSPALYLNEERFITNVTVPPFARENATPAWKVVDKTGRFEWHDHRIHYMGKGVPTQVKDDEKRTRVFAWQVPLEVNGRPAKLRGDLYWEPDSGGGLPRGALLALAALVFGGIFFVEIVRRRRRRAAGRRPAGSAWE